jgi:RimJ/RimL family protein N-acetyltransferase
MISDFAFAIGFRRLFAITLPDNLASQKSLLNAGFELETVLRDAMTRRNGVQANAVMFAKFPTTKVKI